MDSLLDLDISPAISDYFLPEEIWSKFDIEQSSSGLFSSIDSLNCDLNCEEKCLIHHDCMWTGHCGSKEHNNADEQRSYLNTFITPPDDVKPPAGIIKPQVPAQQSLLKPAYKMGVVNPSTIVPMMPNNFIPQTPPMSDDEEKDVKPPLITQTLQSLHDHIFENIIDEDGDLDKYFKEEDFGVFENDDLGDDDEEEEEEEEGDEDDIEDEDKNEVQVEIRKMQHHLNLEQMRAFYAAESDHSYHKGNVIMRPKSLGIDTPSDSEEEIDVVSLGDKYNGGALPTNPSSKDRHQLQRTMQSCFPQGVKTMMPQKQTPNKSKSRLSISHVNNQRAVAARSRHHTKRVSPSGHRQYKRRYVYGHHSSDSEPEPSEKRNLHNNMERQRRIDLRNLFEDLKTLVPEVNKKQRAAKVLILRGAAQYCRSLTNTSNALNRQVDDLRKQQEMLRARVSHLRRNLAANR